MSNSLTRLFNHLNRTAFWPPCLTFSFVPASQELPLGAQEVRQAGGPMHLDARGDPGDVRGLPPGEVPLRVSARRLPDGRSQVAS